MGYADYALVDDALTRPFDKTLTSEYGILVGQWQLDRAGSEVNSIEDGHTVSVTSIIGVVGRALALHAGDGLIVRLLGLLRLSVIVAPDGVGCGSDNLVNCFHIF